MPYINFKTNVKIENVKEIHDVLGELITIIPNKTLAVTMMDIEGERNMFYAGTDEPCAMVETHVDFGTDQSNVKAYGDAVIAKINEKLGIPKNRIYVTVNALDNWFACRP